MEMATRKSGLSFVNIKSVNAFSRKASISNKTMGDKAAANGTKMDLVSMNGITMSAVQSLSKKADRILA